MTKAHHQIQRLKPEDIGLVGLMLDLFADAFEEPETYRDRPDSAYLKQLLARDHVHALVALEGGAVVGALVAYELPKFEQARSEIYIYDLAVAAPHRRQGIATAMIHELHRIAADRGAWVLFIQADRGDAPAIALYDKLGVREEVLHFDIPVPPKPKANQPSPTNTNSAGNPKSNP
jgi:aminoglycoside 3-N-acetyltransferase I